MNNVIICKRITSGGYVVTEMKWLITTNRQKKKKIQDEEQLGGKESVLKTEIYKILWVFEINGLPNPAQKTRSSIN